MKKAFIFLFLQLLMSIFLTSESFAFSIKVETSSIHDEGSFIQNPINHQALFVEELGTVKTFEQNFYPQIHFFSENNSRFNHLYFVCVLSENKDNFLFKKNLKKLLSQQIFPFHLFW